MRMYPEALLRELRKETERADAFLITDEVFTGFGRRGVSAERVVDGVLAEARAWEHHDVPIGEHLADQLILPLWLDGAAVGAAALVFCMA